MRLITKRDSWTKLRDTLNLREDFKNNGKTFYGSTKALGLPYGHWLTEVSKEQYHSWLIDDKIQYVITSFYSPIFVLVDGEWHELKHRSTSKTTNGHRNKARVAINL